MATPSMDVTSLVGKLLEEDDVDLLREGVRVLARALMEEVSGQIGAAPYERSSSRTAYLAIEFRLPSAGHPLGRGL